jgi:superfamily I DNA/RNA helicase/RecB family exonuclease
MELDERERRVVEHEGSPLLVLGGPGTGKTSLLEQRYLRLAAELAPHRILILCTNRAYAMGAKDRLTWALPHQAMVEVPVYTWHALANHLVSRYYPSLGYRESPVLLTAPEQWGVVRELLAAEHSADWPLWGERLRERGFIDEVADFCLRVEQRLMGIADLDALVAHRPDWAEIVRFYRRYHEHLKRESRLDYAGLIASAVGLLQTDDGVRETLRRRFPHVLVDEGEEASRAQRELLSLLETANLVVAADPASGIENFRGAEPEWVFGFEKEFGPHETVVLQRAHRLGAPLGAASQSLIAHNDPEASHRLSVAPEHETAFECRLYSSAAEEVDAIARELRHLHLAEGVPWSGMAVLISQPRYLLQPLERALDRWEVPHLHPSGDRQLAAEPAVGCFLDLVRVALKEEGWQDLLSALLTCPLIGLDYADRRKLERLAWQERRSLFDLVEEADETEEWRKLRDLVVAHRESAEECFWQVYSASAYYRGLVEAALSDPSNPANAQVDALVAFSRALGRFVERRHGRGTILDYLHEAARADFGGDPWLAPSRSRDEAVELLSFHAAKGREWDTVVVAGCLDAWIPKGRRAQGLFDPLALEVADPSEREVEAIADDRRTFYVAATRARRKALFTVSPGPSGRGQPSRFLSELAGEPPVEALAAELPPLTSAELRGRLRQVLESGNGAPEERAAALVALAELPGTDPTRWYGRWDWTEGAVPLEVAAEFKTSYSRLVVYDNCGLQYVLQSVLGLDPVLTHSMKFGTWMHALFQAVHEGTISDPARLLAEYRKLFDETAFPNATIARQYRRDGERMLETFWNHEVRPDRTVKTEHAFVIPFAGAALRGRIDRVDKIGKNLVLTDYKTSRWAAGKEESEESLQLAIYHLAAMSDPELQALGTPVAARLVFPGDTWADGKPKERVQKPEQAERVLEKLPPLIEKLVGENFVPSPEADCQWCAMKPMCPLWPEGREL